jgi:alpha-maltose-1-phosphate synthase
VPTLMAPSGEGREASLRRATSNIYYGTWLSARLTAVDIGVAAEAFRALAADPSLRRRMGAAGQARVKGTFDWAAVIPRYLALWREQQAIRLPAPPGRAAPFATRAAGGPGGGHHRPPFSGLLYRARFAGRTGRNWDHWN